MESELMPTTATPLPTAQRVLALAPHPDDEVFGCGGTLHLLAKAGAVITVIVASDGALGGPAEKRETAALVAEREAETRAAATVLGYPAPVFWRLPDRGLRYGEALVAKLLDAISAAHADLVFAPALTELHPDHQVLALATAEALRRLGGERRIAFYEVSAPLLPNSLFDITACEEQKQAAMRCFRTQLAEHPYDERIAALNRYRAYTLGADARAAEAFFMVTAAELANGLTPLFESALARRRRLGIALEGAEMPLVSVIVRSMDRPVLAYALNSVATQIYPNIELVVVNVKGDPHSPLPDFRGRLAARLVETGAPLAPAPATNAGLDAATGRYLLVLDDENQILPDHIEKLVAALRGGRARAAYSGVRLVDGDGNLLHTYDKDWVPARLFGAAVVPIHAVLFDRALLAEGCRFDEQALPESRFGFPEDRGFLLQLAQRTQIERVPGVGAVERRGVDNARALKLAEDEARLRDGACAHSLSPEPDCVLTRDGQARSNGLMLDHAASVETPASAQATEAALRNALGTTQSELSSARSDLAAVKVELEAARVSARSFQTLLERVTRDLHTVLHSRSWKLTAGPRHLVQILRRLMVRLARPFARPGRSAAAANAAYTRWIERHDTITSDRRMAMTEEAADWRTFPSISLVIPLSDPRICPPHKAIESVVAQAYTHWDLCIVTDATADPEVRDALIRYEQRNPRIHVANHSQGSDIATLSNAALASAKGEFIAFINQEDLLPAHALFEVAKAVRNHPDAAMLYSDEDKLSADGQRFDPWFKPDYNYELLLGQNMVGRLCVYRRSTLQEIGGFKAGMNDSGDHDLALRCIEHIQPEQIIHIPKILYHRRASGGRTGMRAAELGAAWRAGLRAVNEHLARTCPGAIAERHPEAKDYCRIRFPLPDPIPRVSIIIPTRNAYRLLRACLESIFEKTRYADYEVIVVDNGSDERTVIDYLGGLAEAGKISLIHDSGPFNFAALNNRAVARSNGEYVVLLNNDIQIVEPDWLAEMISVAARPRVGAVGARLWYPDGTLQHGGVIVGLGGVAGHAHLGLAAGDPGYFGRGILLQTVTAVTAACLVVKRSIFDEVGGLDQENLPVAYNDVDFCLKLVQAGYRNIWTPHAQMIHAESATRGDDFSPSNIESFHRATRFMQDKWGDRIFFDPCFNYNLSLNNTGYVLGEMPRNLD